MLRGTRVNGENPLITQTHNTDPLYPYAVEVLAVLRDGEPHTTRDLALHTQQGRLRLRRVRYALEALEAHGCVIRTWACHRYALVAEPSPDGVCIRCGAKLRRGNAGPWCSPCEVYRPDMQPLVGDYDPREDPEFLDKLHRALIEAAQDSTPEGEAGWVDVCARFNLDPALWKRFIWRQVNRLRAQGLIIEARPGWGYRLNGCHIEDDDAIESTLTSLLGSIVSQTA